MNKDIPRFEEWSRKGLIAAGFFLFLLALAFTAVNLQVSSKIGRLSSISHYDDVVYLNSASEIYFTGRTEGLIAGARLLFSKDLHAPFSVINALFGFILFGPDVPRIYFMLAVVVFAYLAFVALVARKLPGTMVAALALASLGLPFATIAALEFRPDPMWTVLLGGSSVLLLSAERPFVGRWPSVAFGVAFGLVLLAKPSTFAMSFLVLGGVWFLAAAMALVSQRASWREVLAGFAMTAGAALLVAGWYCVPHAREIGAYFYDNSFGANRDVWIFKGSLWQRWTYYLRDRALDSNLAGLVYPLFLVFLWGAVREVVFGRSLFARLRGGAFLWMLGGVLLVNSAFSMKSSFLGGSFYGFLVFGAIWYGSSLLAEGVEEGWLRPPARQSFASLGILSVAMCGYVFPEVCRVDVSDRKAKKSINREILRDLLRESKGADGVLMLELTQSGPVIGEFLQMELRARGKRLGFANAAFAKDSRQVIDLSRRSRYVVVQDQSITGAPKDAIPGEKLQPELAAYFSSRPDWRLVGRYSDKLGKFAYLYKNLHPQE